MNKSNQWSAGDWVIYRKSKRSASPGQRAKEIVAAAKGETYNYIVEKYWVIESVLPDGRLALRTARGKRHVIDPQDRNLRRPGWIRRLLSAHRFRTVEQGLGETHFAA